jgi:hypothetical protein
MVFSWWLRVERRAESLELRAESGGRESGELRAES